MTDPLHRQITIGSVKTRNAVLSAPMSGISDVPFRRAAWAGGAGMVTSEMIASEAYVCGMSEMKVKSESAGLPVHMVQLAGREAKWMARAAALAEEWGADIIDINMGCPARRVTSGLSGSALMRDLDHAQRLIKAVIGAVKLPVTLKMRLGWDENSINAPDLAKRAQDCGVQMITVHGRTRNQFYNGQANWNAVRAVREAINLPLIINGDIACRKSALEAMQVSGADGVMIGRASYGAPDLPGRIAGYAAGDKIIPYDILVHYEEILAYYGEESGVRNARKHIGWFLDRLDKAIPADLKRVLMTHSNGHYVLSELKELLAVVKEHSRDEVAA